MLAHVIFYVSYGILTDKRNSYVFLKRNTEIRLRLRKINAVTQALVVMVTLTFDLFTSKQVSLQSVDYRAAVGTDF